jgi:hypothetical protein
MAMVDAMRAFRARNPEATLDRGMGNFLPSLAVQHAQNYGVHLARNSKGVYQVLQVNSRFLFLQLAVPDGGEQGLTTTERWMLARHVFKRLTNQATFWPPSVLRNDGLGHQIDALYESLFDLFPVNVIGTEQFIMVITKDLIIGESSYLCPGIPPSPGVSGTPGNEIMEYLSRSFSS